MTKYRKGKVINVIGMLMSAFLSVIKMENHISPGYEKTSKTFFDYFLDQTDKKGLGITN